MNIYYFVFKKLNVSKIKGSRTEALRNGVSSIFMEF